MNEEIIRITIDYILNEIKETSIKEMDGLCLILSQNLEELLAEQGINSKIYNIRDLTNVNYDHYFLIAENYLIDLTYSQFLKKEGTLRFFKQWPASILEKTEEGKIILDSLLKEGYFKIDNNLNIYLNSFIGKEKTLWK